LVGGSCWASGAFSMTELKSRSEMCGSCASLRDGTSCKAYFLFIAAVSKLCSVL
jgi:hypothetical protein